MKHLFIVNPAAGKVNQAPRIQRETAALFGADNVEVICSQGRGDCQRIAQEAGERGEPCLLYACGGDGTLNEVVRGAMNHSNLAVTCYPCGSGNDFIKSFPNPDAFYDLSAFRQIRREPVDLMTVNDQISVNVCSAGFDARIGTDISAFRRMPLLSGPRAYHASVVVNLLRGVAKPCRVEIPGQTVVEGEQSLVCICNGSWYGGSYHPVPQADMQDGILDVLIVKKVSRLTVARVISAYQRGEYQKYPQLITHYRTDSLTIQTPTPEPVNLDGELLRTDRVEVKVKAGALRFFGPEEAWKK